MTKRRAPNAEVHRAAGAAAGRAAGLPDKLVGVGSSGSHGERRPNLSARYPGRSRTPADPAPTLWHFCCAHSATGVIGVGALVPRQQPFLPRLSPLVWMTDDPDLDAEALGLTSHHLECDRMEYCFRILDARTCVPWLEVTELAPASVLPRATIAFLHHGRQPEHWWVSAAPVPVAVPPKRQLDD